MNGEVHTAMPLLDDADTSLNPHGTLLAVREGTTLRMFVLAVNI
jgi:hypothetical protein